MTLHRQEMGLELYKANVRSHLAPGVSHTVKTFHRDPVATLGGAEFDSCPGGPYTVTSSVGVSRIDKECSGVLRVSAIGDLEGP